MSSFVLAVLVVSEHTLLPQGFCNRRERNVIDEVSCKVFFFEERALDVHRLFYTKIRGRRRQAPPILPGPLPGGLCARPTGTPQGRV